MIGQPDIPSVLATRLAFDRPGRNGAPGISFFIEEWQVVRGQRVVLHGPSGCGKTTLLELLAGNQLASAGRLEVEGLDLVTSDDRRRRDHRIEHIGFVFQEYPLIPSLDVIENVLLPFRIATNRRVDTAAREHARRCLTRLGMDRHLKADVESLSQGERQRVAIARAVVMSPALILADEPTAGLDPGQSLLVVDLIQELASEVDATLIMATHDPVLLERFDHRVPVAEWSRPT